MTFLSLQFPALVFREQLGLWGGKGTEYLFVALQKAGSKRRREKAHLSPPEADDAAPEPRSSLACRRDLADTQQGHGLV